MKIDLRKKLSLSGLLSFILPSLIGVIFFMTPIKINGEITIPVAFVSKSFVTIGGEWIQFGVFMAILIAALGSILVKLIKNKVTLPKFILSLFDVSSLWFVARILGATFIICAKFQLGPEIIWADITGGLVYNDLLPTLFSVFLFAGLFLPLLLNYGLLEFIGSLLTKVMRPIFKLPGRSSIDCIASWLGDGSIGILLTSKQYEQKFYTKKEAAIIGTSFSAVSLTFSLVVISQVGLSHLFVPFYLTVTIAGILAAIIIPRIPPLSRKPDTFIDGSERKDDDAIPEGYTTFSYGLTKAVERAENGNSIKAFLMEGIINVLDMWIGVLCVVMAMGTLALIIAEFTPIFQWLGTPFIPLLNLLQVPEAAAASQTLIVGFADMFIPSVLATSISSELTRFIIAAVSVTQLIYMSEVGGLLLGSKIPVSFKDLVFIFLQRTIVTLPIIVVCANIIFGWIG